jgi:hypothetical protein
MTDKERERIEADLLAEDVGGAAIQYGSTEKAIAALEKRIAWLRQRITDAQKRIVDVSPEFLRSVVEPLQQQIATAETDLARYRAQVKARN